MMIKILISRGTHLFWSFHLSTPMVEFMNRFEDLDPDLNYFSEIDPVDSSNYLTVEEYNELCLKELKKQFK